MQRTRQQSFAAKHARPQGEQVRMPDPSGRVDIAFARILELGVARSTDPLIRVLYAQFQPQINAAITLAVGPRTGVGRTAKTAVQALQLAATEHGTGNVYGTRGAA